MNIRRGRKVLGIFGRKWAGRIYILTLNLRKGMKS